MTTNDVLAVKKRLMFVNGEDFNYLAYNVLLILQSLKCRDETTALRDHRKCAFLVDLISSPSLAIMIDRSRRLKRTLSDRDAHTLTTAYSKAISRQHLIARVVSALHRRDIVTAGQQPDGPVTVLWLNEQSVPSGFLDSPIYEMEHQNICLLKKVCPQLRTVSLATCFERFYADQGVLTWRD